MLCYESIDGNFRSNRVKHSNISHYIVANGEEVTENDRLIKLTAIASRRPLTLGDFREFIDELIAWQGEGYEVPSNVYLFGVRINVIKKILEAITEHIKP